MNTETLTTVGGDPAYTHCDYCGHELAIITYKVIRVLVQVTCENPDCPVCGHTVNPAQHREYCEAARQKK